MGQYKNLLHQASGEHWEVRKKNRVNLDLWLHLHYKPLGLHGHAAVHESISQG